MATINSKNKYIKIPKLRHRPTNYNYDLKQQQHDTKLNYR